MNTVIDDIVSHRQGMHFHLEEIEKIYAVRFPHVFSSSDFENVLSSPAFLSKKIRTEYIHVHLREARLNGTHAYKLYLFNGDEICLPIW